MSQFVMRLSGSFNLHQLNRRRSPNFDGFRTHIFCPSVGKFPRGGMNERRSIRDIYEASQSNAYKYKCNPVRGLRFCKTVLPRFIAQRVDRFTVIAKNVESLSWSRARTQRSAPWSAALSQCWNCIVRKTRWSRLLQFRRRGISMRGLRAWKTNKCLRTPGKLPEESIRFAKKGNFSPRNWATSRWGSRAEKMASCARFTTCAAITPRG